MLPPLIDITPFCLAIEADQLILTSNQRLAAQITQAWGQRMATEKRSVWQAPRVFSIEHWLSQCWDELQDQNYHLVEGLAVVGKQQSRYYWDRAISQQNPDLGGRYAKTAEKTLTIVQKWQLTVEQIPADSPAVEHFKGWAGNFHQLLKRNDLVTSADSWRLVGQGFEENALATEGRILLYGFQSISPLQQAVLQQASPNAEQLPWQSPEAGEVANNVEIQSSELLACANPNQELIVAANWAATELASNPAQRVGIVIPDLNNQLQPCIRTVSEALQSHSTEVAVNISAGVSLADTPIVKGALQLLGLFRFKAPLQEWLDLVYCPFSLFSQLRVQVRVDIELALRKSKRFDFTLDQFISAVNGSLKERSDIEETQALLLPMLELQQKQRQQSHGLQSFAAWAQFFDQFLYSFGWPGTRSINSLEYQQRHQWKNTLEQLAELDNLSFEVGIATAITHLQQLAQDKVFHPQTGDAPLQVLGLLEASGLRFDQLWILGMTNQTFPASVSINPMLPAEFQRQHQMPHALPQRELEIANELLRGFQANAKKLILSYPQQRDEETLEPSPLLRDLPQVKGNNLTSQAANHPPWLEQPDLTELLEDFGPAYQPDNEQIRGGSSLLKNQSVCPFNAFAIHRLGAAPLEEPSHGLSPADRGSMLHDVMYRLWGNWKTSATLESLPEQQLNQQVSEGIAATLLEFGAKHRILQGKQYLQLEQRRLEKLIGQWLVEEKQRPAFAVVEREHEVSLKFGNLKISMRLDRVDMIQDKFLVIDYKTGVVKPGNWMGERPKDPQLPLYLLASDPPANGCAFAQIKGGKIRFTGHSDSQLISGETPLPDWSAQVNQWYQALSNLANEFVSGHAPVEVYEQTEFRYQAPLLPLNRWYEQNEIQAADVDTSATGSQRQL
jgi:ATP-dependent helicase/nuclease subunit B